MLATTGAGVHILNISLFILLLDRVCTFQSLLALKQNAFRADVTRSLE